MDLHIVGAEPSEAERQAVDRLLGPPVSGWEGGARDIARDGRTAPGGRQVSGDRDLLLPVFHAVQDSIGWISHGALNYICRRLSVPPAEAWGVVTFYHLLATEPQPQRRRPCLRRHRVSPSWRRVRSAADLRSAGRLTVKRSPCLGQCDRGSAALVTIARKDARALRPRTLRTRTTGTRSRTSDLWNPWSAWFRPSCCRSDRPSRSVESRGLSQEPAATRPWRKRSRWAPIGHRRSDRGEVDGPRRRGISDRPQVGGRREGKDHAALRRL